MVQECHVKISTREKRDSSLTDCENFIKLDSLDKYIGGF